jgi:quinol monooxygenase YgiN
MTVEYIRYKIEQPQREAFVKAYAEAAGSLDASVYCLGYELSECEEEQGTFILRIEWSSTDDHLNGFRKSEQFASFLPQIRPYIPNIQEMRHYAITQMVKRKSVVPD